MNYIDFSNLGGLPFSQNRANFLQQSYLSAFGAFAKLCGDKVILTGVESDGVNVTDGWISYNGELIPFIGGLIATQVVISTTAVPFTFGDATIHDVQFTKTATCGLIGSFDFVDLKPLLTLQNTWITGDVKEVDCSLAYIAANFDGTGLGINERKGWAICNGNNGTKNRGGKVSVAYDPADVDFDDTANTGGEKKHTLLPNEQGDLAIQTRNDDFGGGGANNAIGTLIINGATLPGSSNGALSAVTDVPLASTADEHNNMQPYIVSLHIMKL